MNRAAVSVFFVGALLVGATACGDHEAEPTPTTFDFTPVATISAADDGITCVMAAAPTSCELESGSVVSVENTGEVDHRLVGTKTSGGNAFDSGRMQPGDEMTLVLTADGIVTITDLLWPDGESPALDVNVISTDTAG